MLRHNGTKLVNATLTGLFVGMIFGQAIGRGLGSDNVPFFIMLGAVVGVSLGAAVGYLLERRRAP